MVTKFHQLNIIGANKTSLRQKWFQREPKEGESKSIQRLIGLKDTISTQRFQLRLWERSVAVEMWWTPDVVPQCQPKERASSFVLLIVLSQSHLSSFLYLIISQFWLALIFALIWKEKKKEKKSKKKKKEKRRSIC